MLIAILAVEVEVEVEVVVEVVLVVVVVVPHVETKVCMDDWHELKDTGYLQRAYQQLKYFPWCAQVEVVHLSRIMGCFANFLASD